LEWRESAGHRSGKTSPSSKPAEGGHIEKIIEVKFTISPRCAWCSRHQEVRIPRGEQGRSLGTTSEVSKNGVDYQEPGEAGWDFSVSLTQCSNDRRKKGRRFDKKTLKTR